MSFTFRFDDLFDLREGEPGMTMGTGPTRINRIHTLEQWQAKADALRELYRWTLGRRPDGYDVPLDLTIDTEQECEGYLKRTVSYNVGPKQRIKAYVLIPADSDGKLPGILTLHPTNAIGREQAIGNDPAPGGYDRAYGLHLAERGYVTLSYDLDSTHDRMYPGATDPFDNTAFYRQCPEWSGRGKDLYDVSRAVDVLEQMPEVDPKRIGSIGHSQGGGLTSDAMALEPRIVAGVDNCGDWPLRMSRNPYNRCRTGWWIGNPQLRPFVRCGKFVPIDVHEKLALAAPRALMMIVSLNDFSFTEQDEWLTRPGWDDLGDNVRRVYDLHGQSDKFQLVMHMQGHSFLEPQREIAYAFLDKHLKTT